MQPHATPSQKELQEIPYGYCQCGCGELAPIAKRTDRSSGRIKGEPQRYVKGHQGRTSHYDASGRKICCKCGEAKSLTNFPVDVSRADGHYVYCKVCVAQRAKNRRAQNRAVDKAQNPEKYAALPGEIFKDISGYDGKYQVSNFGRVRSFSFVGRGRILKAKPDPYGYLNIDLFHDGKHSHWRIHILVLTTFVCPRPDGLIANHKDGNKTNNAVGNLEWVTHSENVRHSLYVLGNPKQTPPIHRGENNPQSKLTWDQVREMRRLRAEEGVSFIKLARRFGIAKSTAMSIIKGKIWREDV